ncbi:MAG: hypothetical protein ACRCYZ_01050 [Alphaproteobacteria bacterium]
MCKARACAASKRWDVAPPATQGRLRYTQRFTAAILTSFFVIPAAAGIQKNPPQKLKKCPRT